MHELAPKIKVAADYVRGQWPVRPRVGIILGTGLGSCVPALETQASLPYERIPHFSASTATGHEGRLVCGAVGAVPVMVAKGRFHYYEGHSLSKSTLPVRVMRELGTSILVVTNAAGGINPRFATADVVVIDDHINLMNANPLVGKNDDQLGPRFPDMSCPYDRELAVQAMAVSRREGFVCHRGVYAAMPGPNYETRAEYRFLRRIGADVVGMSTVPEALVAAHCGMRVLGLSVVTNVCQPDTLQTTDGEFVRSMAERAESRVGAIIQAVLAAQQEADE